MMSRKTKPQQNGKQGGKLPDVDGPVFGESCPDLSSIERDSIFQIDPSNSDGNPLHSTALEDDFSPFVPRKKLTPARGQDARTPAGRMDTPHRPTGAARRPSAGKGGKSMEKAKGRQGKGMEKQPTIPVFKTPFAPAKVTLGQMRKISEESGNPRSSVSGASASQVPAAASEDVDDSSEMETESEEATSGGVSSSTSQASRRKSLPVFPSRQEAGEGTSTQPHSNPPHALRPSQGPAAPIQPQPRKSRGRVSSGRVRLLQKIAEENESQPRTSESSDEPETASDDSGSSAPPGKRRNRRSPQESQESGTSSNQHAGGKKRARKSTSSSSSDAGAKSRRKKGALRNPIDLEVILEHFLDFVEKYKETVDSIAVQKAIDYMSESFVEQMTEAITAAKDLNSVKKKNMKLNTAINRKRSSLLDAKYELLKSEAAVHALQKEHGELQQRLTDMTNGMTLLRDLTDLHTKYAAHCDAHPDLPPTYGPTSLPALLLEARCMMGAEHQLKAVNAKLQKVLDDVNRE
ncbi:centromere protein U isoform X2 [Engraulis encrasicolus]|uniref:centromere protein U isoform X2 n=1 Tax=Engraulis encrasicolus TaxID=184585 RepID=UPI002FD0ABB8